MLADTLPNQLRYTKAGPRIAAKPGAPKKEKGEKRGINLACFIDDVIRQILTHREFTGWKPNQQNRVHPNQTPSVAQTGNYGNNDGNL